MFPESGDHISTNMSEQEVPLKPMLKPAGNNIRFPSRLCVCVRGGKNAEEENKDAEKRKRDKTKSLLKLWMRELAERVTG